MLIVIVDGCVIRIVAVTCDVVDRRVLHRSEDEIVTNIALYSLSIKWS